MDEFQFSRDHHVTNHFRKKSIIFRDTRDHQEYDAKNRLSIPGLSSEKPLAEVISDKRKPTLANQRSRKPT